MNEASAKLSLARVGAILAFLAATIFAIGFVIQMTGEDTIFPILITGGAGLTLLVGASYLVLSSRRPVSWSEASRSGASVLRLAAIVASLIVVASGVASLASGPGLVTSIILILVGLQAPIAMVMAAGFIRNGPADS